MGNPTLDRQIPLQPTKKLDSHSVALCFKVPFDFRQRLKMLALQRSLTMTELLVLAVESYEATSHPPMQTISVRTEIRK